MDPNNINHTSTWDFVDSRLRELSRLFTIEAWLDRILELMPDFVSPRTLAVVHRFKLDCASTNICTRLDEMPSPIPDQGWIDRVLSNYLAEDERYQVALNHLSNIETEKALLILQYYLPAAFPDDYITHNNTSNKRPRYIQNVDDAIHLMESRPWCDILTHAAHDLNIVAANPPHALWPPFYEAMITLCDMMQWRNTTVFCAVVNLGFLADRPKIHWLDVENDEEGREYLSKCMVRDLHLLDHLGPESRKVATVLRDFARMIIPSFVEPVENVFSAHDEDHDLQAFVME